MNLQSNYHPTTLYALKVGSGDIPACKLLIQACERHLDDLERGHERGLYFDVDDADHAIEFFSFLRHSKGEWAGQSFALELWQKFIIGSIFGWKRADGLRRFRQAYVEVPRKNGKSTLTSGIGLYLLVADGEPGAEIYTAATKKDQARIIHGEATRMVVSSPALRKRVGIYKDNLHVTKTFSKYEPLSADSKTMDGLNVHGALIDELHAHPTSGVVDVLDTGTGSRRQPLIFEITTAGWDRESVCWRHHDYSRQVLEKLVDDDSWFAFIASIDKKDDWTSEEAWQKANPNYGISLKADDFHEKVKRAKAIPTEQNAFKRLKLNIWTEQFERWLDIDRWDKCATALADLEGRRCYAGLDLASTIDIAALVLVFPGVLELDELDQHGELKTVVVYDVLPFFWVPKEKLIERAKNSEIPWLVWEEEGLLIATEGNVIHYAAINHKFDELAQLYDIEEVAFDRWGATQMVQDMEDAGLDVIPIGQGYASMSPPTKELQNLTLSEQIRHAGNPVLRWMAGNMVVRQDAAENIKPDKSKSADKIDGMVALIMAIDRAVRYENVYDDRGILVF